MTNVWSWHNISNTISRWGQRLDSRRYCLICGTVHLMMSTELHLRGQWDSPPWAVSLKRKIPFKKTIPENILETHRRLMNNTSSDRAISWNGIWSQDLKKRFSTDAELAEVHAFFAGERWSALIVLLDRKWIVAFSSLNKDWWMWCSVIWPSLALLSRSWGRIHQNLFRVKPKGNNPNHYTFTPLSMHVIHFPSCTTLKLMLPYLQAIRNGKQLKWKFNIEFFTIQLTAATFH